MQRKKNELPDEKSISSANLTIINNAMKKLSGVQGISGSSLEEPLKKVKQALSAVLGTALHQDLESPLLDVIMGMETCINTTLTNPFPQEKSFDQLEEGLIGDNGVLTILDEAIDRLSQSNALSNTQKQAFNTLDEVLCDLLNATSSCRFLLDELDKRIKKLPYNPLWNQKTIAAARKLHSEMYGAHQRSGSNKLTKEEEVFLHRTVCCVGQFLQNPTNVNVQGRLKDLARTVPAVKYPNLRRVVGALLFFAGIALSIFIPLALGGGLALMGGGAALFVSASNKMPVDALRQFQNEAEKEAKERAVILR